MKIMKLIRQDVCVWYKVKFCTTKSLLHLNIVVAKSVFSGDFIAHGEMVDPLELVEAFVEVALARTGRP